MIMTRNRFNKVMETMMLADPLYEMECDILKKISKDKLVDKLMEIILDLNKNDLIKMIFLFRSLDKLYSGYANDDTQKTI